MEKLVFYRQVIRDLLYSYAKYQPSIGEVQVEVIIDEAQDHYELIYAGWSGPYRIHGSVIHIDLRHDKIWIQYDGMEDGIAYELVKAGIPHDQIILAFKHPDIRPYTEFAVG